MSRAEVEGFALSSRQKLEPHIQRLSTSYPDNPHARIAEEFYRLASQDPNAAAARIREFLGSEADPYGIGISGWPITIIKGLGFFYSDLERESRETGLKGSLGFLDTVTNYFEAQDVVEKIDDPWLVGDILANRSLYWPGFRRYSDALKTQRTWEEAQPTIDTAESSFWLAYAMARTDITAPEVRQAFQTAYPELVDQTNDAIAAMTNSSALHEHGRHPEISVEEGIDKRLKERYDPVLHNEIRTKIQEAKWILLPDHH